MFYVYEWIRPDYNLTFWVGKGKENRAWDLGRNDHCDKIVNKLKKENRPHIVSILAQFETEKAAFDYEQERIKFLSPLGELANKTEGGEGCSGYKHTSEAKIKISITHSGENNVMKNPHTARKQYLSRLANGNVRCGDAVREVFNRPEVSLLRKKIRKQQWVCLKQEKNLVYQN